MPLTIDTERQLATLAEDIRTKVAALAPDDDGAALRRLAAMLKASDRVNDRDRLRERARLVMAQGGRCAVCLVAFSEAPPATRGQVVDRLLCGACARESRIPPPPRDVRR